MGRVQTWSCFTHVKGTMSDTATPDQKKLVYEAKLAEQAERYDEMKESMRKVAEEKKVLTTEERNLLSVAYKNVVGARRASWRIITSIEQKEQNKQAQAQSENLAIVTAYKAKIEGELKEICEDIQNTLSEHLVPACNEDDGESKVFYNKMQGDYFRYMAEFTDKETNNTVSNKALDAYTKAQDTAMTDLPPTHPIRLGLALNFSVFHYEIMSDPNKACALAKQAFDDAIAELDMLNEDSYKDSTLIMQLLRDNLTLWTSDIDAPDEEKEDGAEQ